MKKALIYMLLIVCGCAILWEPEPERLAREQKPAYMQDTVKWNQFLECSENEGDLGCDSCFFLIYGYHVEDAGYGNYTPIEE